MTTPTLSFTPPSAIKHSRIIIPKASLMLIKEMKSSTQENKQKSISTSDYLMLSKSSNSYIAIHQSMF